MMPKFLFKVFIIFLLTGILPLISYADDPTIKLSCFVSGEKYSSLNNSSETKKFTENIIIEIFIFNGRSNVSQNQITMINTISDFFKTPVANHEDMSVKHAIDNSDNSSWKVFNKQDNDSFVGAVDMQIDRNSGLIKAFNHVKFKGSGLIVSVSINGKCDKSEINNKKF